MTDSEAIQEIKDHAKFLKDLLPIEGGGDKEIKKTVHAITRVLAMCANAEKLAARHEKLTKRLEEDIDTLSFPTNHIAEGYLDILQGGKGL